MRSATYHLSIGTARADALFASAVQRSDQPSAAQINQAIAVAVRTFGTRGCAARVAQAFGKISKSRSPARSARSWPPTRTATRRC